MTPLRVYANVLDEHIPAAGQHVPAHHGDVEAVTMFEMTTEEMHVLARLAERDGDQGMLDRDRSAAALAMLRLSDRLLRAEARALAALTATV